MEKESKKKKIIFSLSVVLCAAVVVLLICWDAAKESKSYESRDMAMGTVVTQQIYGKDAEQTGVRILSRIKSMETNEISWRISASDTAKINEKKRMKISAGTYQYLGTALDVCRKTQGAFDITIGALTRQWNIGDKDFRVLTKPEAQMYASYVDYAQVKLENGTVTIGENQLLDFGGIGKGIACDEAKKLLEDSRTESAVISVGGSILLWDRNTQKSYSVGIRDPEGSVNDFMAMLTLNNTCVSTSGDYERYSESGGEKYHHILDSKTGYPVQSDLSSVTAVCASGLVSDALSTACYVLGYEKSLPVLAEYDAQAVFVYKDKKVKVTDGLKDKIEMKSDAYSLEP